MALGIDLMGQRPHRRSKEKAHKIFATEFALAHRDEI